jgi:hypothetical protein
MSDIGNTLSLWVVNRHNTFLVLAQGLTGTPEPVEPSPILHKAAYLSIHEASSDLHSSSTHLDGPYVTLLAKLPSPDGPPAQTAILFPHQREETISYASNGRSFHSEPARQYHAAGPSPLSLLRPHSSGLDNPARVRATLDRVSRRSGDGEIRNWQSTRQRDRNKSEVEPLSVIDFDTRDTPEICRPFWRTPQQKGLCLLTLWRTTLCRRLGYFTAERTSVAL